MFLFAIIFHLFFFRAQAAEIFDLHGSARALGMGNAYTAIVRDGDALYYNPAGLARASGFNWSIFSLPLGLSGLDAVESFSGLTDEEDFADTVRDLYGKRIWLGGGLKSTFYCPWFALGAFDAFDVSVGVNNPSVPELQVNAVNDYGVALGFAAAVLPGLHLGASLKRVVRMGNRVNYGPTFLGSLDPDVIVDDIVETKGTAFAMDLAVNLAVPAPTSPALSFVWRNVGVTKYIPESSDDPAPPRDMDEMVVGMGLTVDAGLIAISPAFDYRYLNHSDVQIGKKINFGVEVSAPLLDIRAGYSQGYYSLGAGINLGLLSIQAATYGVELGEYPSQLEDRRYMVQIALELGVGSPFDIFGGNSSGGGKGKGSGSRRLKQRR